MQVQYRASVTSSILLPFSSIALEPWTQNSTRECSIFDIGRWHCRNLTRKDTHEFFANKNCIHCEPLDDSLLMNAFR